MSRWKKGEKEFAVTLSDDRTGSMICRVPKPILNLLENPNGIKFVISGKKIVVEANGKERKRSIKST